MGSLEGSKREVTDLVHALGTTGDGMVGVAPGGEILTWNGAATELLGFSAEEAVGRPCFEVFGWLDRCGNPVCSAFCPDCRLSGGEEQIQTRDVISRTKSGKAVWLSVSTLVPPPELRHECRLVHLFREVGLPPELERLVAERIRSADAQPAELTADESRIAALERLTPREREVLRLIADGFGPKEIAGNLSVSVTTVRNHIRHILEKLGVHSKLEAAVLFIRHGS